VEDSFCELKAANTVLHSL